MDLDYLQSSKLYEMVTNQRSTYLQGAFNNRAFWLGLQTQTALTYRIEFSTNLLFWEPLVDNLSGNGKLRLLLDPDSSEERGARFYRWFQLSGTASNEPPGNPDPNCFVWICPGAVIMGADALEAGYQTDEQPRTVVSIPNGFWMSRHEVTQQEYQTLIGSNPSWFTNNTSQPVECVSWSEATNYCALLTWQEQVAGRLPSNCVYRLPTEAEWEYACRAGGSASFSFGDDPTGSRLGYYAWSWENSGSTNLADGRAVLINGAAYSTHPVETKQPNRWGLMDMHGGVWEWCLDWYGPYQGGSVENPSGPRSGTVRVIRGGSWNSGSPSCRSANRSAAFPQVRSSGIGFRVVLARQY